MKSLVRNPNIGWPAVLYYALRFWPLILAGRLMARVVLNLWDMLEP